MKQFDINMRRPNTLYAVGLGIIIFAALVLSNAPMLSLSNWAEIPLKREACAALFVLGAVFGAVTAQRYMRRMKTPWRTPQSQVALPYLMFFVCVMSALILAR